MHKKKIAVISGAGMSAESGLSTFRGAGGLWEGYDIMQVASIEGWQKDPETVLEFYNQRRRQLLQVKPNPAHLLLAQLEDRAEVTIVTQNVDDLHERAGSSNIIHLHGQLNKVRSSTDPNYIADWTDDLKLGECCPKGGQLRPHIVWFGEMVPLIDVAAQVVRSSDIVVVVGTSLQVYPAAGLVLEAATESQIWYIDPHPTSDLNSYFSHRLTVVREVASVGLLKFKDWYLKNL
nr:NAD-dependent deacylase [Saprospiraceae bacterium]